MKGTVAKDLDLNMDQRLFLSEDETHVPNSVSTVSVENPNSAIEFNLNENNIFKPSEKERKSSAGAENSFKSLMGVQEEAVKPLGPMVKPPRAHDQEINGGMGSDLNEISVEVLGNSVPFEVSRAKETRIGVSVDGGSAKLGDVVNGSAKFGNVVNREDDMKETFGVKVDREQDLGSKSTYIALQDPVDSGILSRDTVNRQGLSGVHGDIDPIEKPKVSLMEEPFDPQGNVNLAKNSNLSILQETPSSIHNPASMQEVDHSKKISSPLDTQMEICTMDSLSLQATKNVVQTQTGKDAAGSGPSHTITNSDSEKRLVEIEYNFSVGDFVWCKVKHHLWWPGRVSDPLDVSNSIRKPKKKYQLLVANFGNQKSAWCEVSHLKSFQENFVELAKQSTSKAFCNAVDKALVELARQEQFGLTCSCLARKTPGTLENKAISSGGLRQGAVVNNPRDITFDPWKLLTYVRELAEFPFTNNTLEITLLSAQVFCFYAAQRHLAFGEPSSTVLLKRGYASKSVPISKSLSSKPKNVKSYDSSPGKHRQSLNKRWSLKNKKRLFEDSQVYGASEQDELPLKNTTETPKRAQKKEVWTGKKLSQSTTKKQRRNEYVFASGGYRKGSKGQQGKKNMHSASSIFWNADGDAKKIPKTFKIGECIRKIASQLSGSPPIIKSIDPTVDETPEKGRKKIKINDKEHAIRLPSSLIKSPLSVREDCSVEELLLDLFLVAQNPIYFLEETDVFSRVTSIFLKFRDEVFEKDSVYPSYRRPSKHSSKLTVSPSMDDSDDSDESNWADKIIASRPVGNRVRRKRKAELQAEETEQKPKRRIRSPNSTPSKNAKKLKDHIRSPDPTPSKEDPLSPANNLMDSSQESPTALFMKFPPEFVLPSESELKEMFVHYGKISETKFFSDSGCAQVIFSRCSDAEAAFHGAPANKVFGPATVSFRLRYLSSRKNIDMAQTEDPREDETNILSKDRNISRNVEDVKETDGQPHV